MTKISEMEPAISSESVQSNSYGGAVLVIQHTDGEFLGRVEDHLEGRGVAFSYVRPHVAGSWLPKSTDEISALFLLGGGPWGTAGTQDLPIWQEEVEFTKSCLENKIPVIGFGLGAQILCLATGGGSESMEYTMSLETITRTSDDVLNGFMPEEFLHAVAMRDRPVPPERAEILAVDADGKPAVFQIDEQNFGFIGHPGTKVGIVEDLVMEFEECPVNSSAVLDQLRTKQSEIEDALVHIMTGLVQKTNLMKRQDLGRNAAALKRTACAA